MPSSPITQTLYRLLITCATLVPLLTLSEKCPPPLPDSCTCGEEENEGKLIKAVRCAGLTSNHLTILTHLPPGTESLLVKDSNLEDITGKNLKLLPKDLKILHLDGNNIHDFDLKDFLCAHPDLEEIYLVDNTLMWFTIDPKCSRKLRLISLKQNYINFLPNETLDALKELGSLNVDLRDNTFSCDCKLAETVRWIRKKSEGQLGGATITNPELYTCRDGFPEVLMGRRLIDLDPDSLKCQNDPGVEPEEDMTFYNYHSHAIYFMVGFLAFIALVLAIFALYLNFPNVVEAMRNWKEEVPRISNQKQYVSLHNETQA